jgi:hypothetical protein
MNEPTENEIMTGRKWIEIGKMINNLAVEGWEFQLENSLNENGDMMYSVALFDTDDDNENGIYDSYDTYPTPYEAMKVMYFEHFLEMDGEDICIDLPPDVSEQLYSIADKEGITIDEVVCNILKDMFDAEEECQCGCCEEEEDPCDDCDEEDCEGCELAEEDSYQLAKCCNVCKYFSLKNMWCKLNEHPAERNMVCGGFEQK